MASATGENMTDIFKREAGRLLGFIKQRVKAPEDAEDILQDVFVQFVNANQVTDPIEQVGAWLFKVARNKIIDSYRKKKAVPFSQLESGDTDEDGGLSLADILPDISASPDVEYTRSVIWEALERALDQLPEQQREVFILHEMEGKSFKVIAEMTGSSVNTLLSRKRYAVLALRDELNELYQEMINL